MTDEVRVKDLVVANPAAAAVFEEAGIEFCCQGDAPISLACAHAGLSVSDVMARIEKATARVALMPELLDWEQATITELTDDIVARHHGYTRQALAQLRHLLPAADAAYGGKYPVLERLRALFMRFDIMLSEHMDEEESALFPSLVRLEAWRAGGATEHSGSWTERARALVPLMRHDHDATADLMRALRKESHGFRPPAYAGVLVGQVYELLHALEHDLHWHMHLENNILFPRALNLVSAGNRERVQ